MAEEQNINIPKTIKQTAAMIRAQWEKEKDTARAIIKTEFAMVRIREEIEHAPICLEPNAFVFCGRRLITDEELQAPFIEKEALLCLLQELKEFQLAEAVNPTDVSSPTQQLVAIFWKGYRADVILTFEVLKQELGCSQIEWERHFDCAEDNKVEKDEHLLKNHISSRHTSYKGIGLSQIPWKDGRTDFGRIYVALEKYLSCTPAEWERHFKPMKAKSLIGAVSDAREPRKKAKKTPIIANLETRVTKYRILGNNDFKQ
jgi:hypothetical protein